jgi:uncharacterized protein YjbI with pentapeptide repeats
MANEEHISIIKRGVRAWNKWRDKNIEIVPDLIGANLNSAKLIGVNLRRAKLVGAALIGANLNRGDLFHADLRRANLSDTDLSRATADEANFSEADLNGTNFSNSIIGYTSFARNDLSLAKGLDSIEHYGPSWISIDTVYKSKGNISDIFLRRAGIPDNFITYMHSLTGNAFEFYSCFISYSSKNQAFAERLYADLQSKGVRCWFAPEDLKIGDRVRISIDESIRKYDKLLLVLSQHSVMSDWVEKEAETAMERERKEKRTVLFPIRLDNTIMKIESGWPADIRRTRHIGDFRRWKIHDVYGKALDRLMHDLQSAES